MTQTKGYDEERYKSVFQDIANIIDNIIASNSKDKYYSAFRAMLHSAAKENDFIKAKAIIYYLYESGISLEPLHIIGGDSNSDPFYTEALTSQNYCATEFATALRLYDSTHSYMKLGDSGSDHDQFL